MKPLNSIFLGSPDFVVPILAALHQAPQINLNLVITQPDRPVGRKLILTPTPVKHQALEYLIPVLTPSKITPEIIPQLPPEIDIAILAAYGQILPQWFLDIPTHGFLNLHPSHLPKFRGASPTLGPIIRGETITSMTYMLMDQQLDHGPIIAQTETPILPQENKDQLAARMFRQAADQLPSIILDYITGKSTPQPQNHTQATYTPRLTKQDAFLPWELIQTALRGASAQLNLFPSNLQPLIQDIYNPAQAPQFVHQAIRGLSTWPGAWTLVPQIPQPLRLKLITSTLHTNMLQLDQVQPAGKTPISWTEFTTKHSLI